MSRRSAARRWFLTTALSYLGTPYRWGGDDPSGFDCSGLVVECLISCGLLSDGDDFTADGLWRRFGYLEVPRPRAGTLVFWLTDNGRARHVGICLDRHFYLSSSGGVSTTHTVPAAWQNNAWVKIRPLPASANDVHLVDPFRNVF